MITKISIVKCCQEKNGKSVEIFMKSLEQSLILLIRLGTWKTRLLSRKRYVRPKTYYKKLTIKLKTYSLRSLAISISERFMIYLISWTPCIILPVNRWSSSKASTPVPAHYSLVWNKTIPAQRIQTVCITNED